MLALPLLLTMASCGGGDEPAPSASQDEARGKDVSANSNAIPSAADDQAAERDMSGLANKGGSASGSSSAAVAISAIPKAFRGTWATDPANCAARNHNRFRVTANEVNFFESGGEASTIRRNGSALAVTYDESNESMGQGPAVVYFASLDNGGAMRVKRGAGESVRYTRCIADSGEATASPSPTVPARFRATYAPDRRACDENYDYQPTFQNVDVSADRVMFFENGGPVQAVNADGDAVAITFLDTYADQSNRRVIYLHLNGDGTARYRSGPDEPVETFVRCG